MRLHVTASDSGTAVELQRFAEVLLSRGLFIVEAPQLGVCTNICKAPPWRGTRRHEAVYSRRSLLIESVNTLS